MEKWGVEYTAESIIEELFYSRFSSLGVRATLDDENEWYKHVTHRGKKRPPLRNIGSITEIPHKQRFFKMFAQLFIGGECDCLAEIPSIRVWYKSIDTPPAVIGGRHTVPTFRWWKPRVCLRGFCISQGIYVYIYIKILFTTRLGWIITSAVILTLPPPYQPWVVAVNLHKIGTVLPMTKECEYVIIISSISGLGWKWSISQ